MESSPFQAPFHVRLDFDLRLFQPPGERNCRFCYLAHNPHIFSRTVGDTELFASANMRITQKTSTRRVVPELSWCIGMNPSGNWLPAELLVICP